MKLVDASQQHFRGSRIWRRSEGELREARKATTFAVMREVDDVDRVARIVESLFSAIQREIPE